MPTTKIKRGDTASLRPSSPVSLIGQGGGSESHRETQSCLLGTRRGETRADLPAFSTFTTEGLGHPSRPPDPSEDTASPPSPGPRGPPSGTKLPGTPGPKRGGSHHHLGSDTLTVMSFLPVSALSSRRSAGGGRDQTLSPGRTVGLGARREQK